MTKKSRPSGPESRRGRPPLDEADQLRAKVWYSAVKARGNWSDYKLDVEFAREEGEERRCGSDRRRAFEEVRRTGSVPTQGTHARRSFDLVGNVDAHPEFSGTAKYFHSLFWDLLKGRTMTLPEAHAFVSKCLATSNVYRLSNELHFVQRYLPVNGRLLVPAEMPDQLVYAGALDNLIKQTPVDLDLLALIGGLFREAFLVCALEIASVLKGRLNNLLEEFCAQTWLVDTENLHLLAERRILFWQMEKNYDGGGLYGDGPYDDFPPAVVSRPLFPYDDSMRKLVTHEKELSGLLMRVIAESMRQSQMPEE